VSVRRIVAAGVLCAALLGTAAARGTTQTSSPVISFDLVGTAGANGWYVSPTTVRWTVTDTVSGIKSSSGCDATVVNETAGTRLTCSATNFADITSTVSVVVKVDTTPPVVTGASPDRPPDVGSWYNHPVTWAFTGADGTSGVASCSSATYSAPDTGSASVSGTCTDVAGNVSAARASPAFSYDSTPPALNGVAARAGDAEVTVAWSPLPASDWVDVYRSVATAKAAPKGIYHGDGGSLVDKHLENGVQYRYEIVAHDQAGHETVHTLTARPLGAMRTPPPGARIARAPTLSWRAQPGAVLYNVQLFRGSTKLLSAWPKSRALRLPRQWTFKGRVQRLTPGAYRWYVWPAYRKGKGYRFGPLVGRSTFVLTG
jgi:hypothetical protein